MHKHPLVM